MTPSTLTVADTNAFAVTEELGIVYPNGTEALRTLSMSLAAGEFVSLVGPSGCGKSTVLKVLAGLLPPSRGRFRVGPADAPAGATAPDVAFVFQHPNLLSWRTIGGNVRLPLELRPGRERTDPGRVREVLEWVGLADFQAAHPAELSGGMQMRASLARALVTRPHLLLLDEPFGALDDLTRLRLNEELSTLWQRDRWTALFVTHNVAEAVFLSSRVLVLSPRPGRLVAEIPIPLEYPRRPELRTTASFNTLVSQVAGALALAGGAPS